MPNPPKPLEQKRLLGNPGRQPIPKQGALPVVQGGYVDPMRPLEYAGKQLWDSVFKHGELWVSSRTDVHFLLMTCEQLDRRETLRSLLTEKPEDRALIMSLNEVEKMIGSNLGQLGFTPAERTRLNLAEVKARSKIEEMRAGREY